MFVVLYGVALAMVAAGAYAAFTGWEFLMLERGWSMVIAGATLATGGLVLGGVTAAAQALAKRLDALAEALRGSARTQPPPFPKRPPAPEPTREPAAPVPRPPDREIEPRVPAQASMTAPAREPVSPAGPGPMAALGIGGVAAEAVAADAARPPPEPEGGLRPIDLEKASDRAEPAPPEAGEPVEAVGTAADAEPPEQPREPAADEAEEPREPRETPPAETLPAETLPDTAAVAGPGIEEPVTGRRERGRIEAEAQALARRFEETSVPFGFASPAAGETEPAPPRASPALEDSASQAEPADAPHAQDAAIGPSLEAPGPEEAVQEEAAQEEAAQEEAAQEEAAQEEAAQEEAGAEPAEPPVVVGTHESGGNRYVMYSDGSIEAETPDGRLLFGSIDELKGYIASGGEDPTGASQTGPR